MHFVKTFKIPKGSEIARINRKNKKGEIETEIIYAPTDMMGITGDCGICHQFPCKHTGYAVTEEFQTKEQ